MRRCLSLIGYFAGCLLFGAFTAQGQMASTDLATVHIFAMLPFGGPAADAAIFLKGVDDSKRDYHQFGSSAEFAGVPFGKYVLRLTHLESSLERSIDINAQEIWIRQAVPMGLMHFARGGGSIRGVISAFQPSRTNVWARVTAVYGDLNREVPVDKRGRFAIDGLDLGIYVLQIIEGSECVYAKSITVRGDSEAPIRIAPGSRR